MRLRLALSCAAAAVLTLWLAAGCTLLPPANPLDEEPPQAEPADARPPSGATEIEAQTAEVRIGLLIPPADSGDSLTTATRQGLELALKQRQQEAGGLPIVLVEGGETGALRDPATAAAAAERLISRDEVHALVSSLVFDQAAGAAIVAETAQTPFVSLTVDDHVLSEGRPYVFLTAADERQRALAAAEYARTRAAAERAVVIYDLASPVGAEAARTFAAAFSEAGGQLIRTIGVVFDAEPLDAAPEPQNPAAADLVEQLASLAEAAPDVLFAPVPVPQATIIADAARQAGLTATLLGGVDWSRAEPADRLTGAVSVADFHPERDDEATRAFVEAYREAYGSIPSAAAALAYDGLQRLLLAVEGTVASGRFDAGDVGATRTALQALLRQAGEYQGVTGRWWMEAPDRARKTVPIVRLDVGEPPAATYLGDF